MAKAEKTWSRPCMFPLIKPGYSSKDKDPMFGESRCATVRTDGASGSFASSKTHSHVRRRLTGRVKVKHKQLWIQRYSLNFEHILRAWVFHSCAIPLSIFFLNLLLLPFAFLQSLLCLLISFMSQSLIPSALLPLTHELCFWALPYTCKKRLNRLLIYTWDFGDELLNWNNGTGKFMLPQRCWPGQMLLLSCLISTLRRVFLTIMRPKM